MPFDILDGDEDVTATPNNPFVNDLEGLVLHELGHAAMGLDHPPWEQEDPDQRLMYVGDFGNPMAPPCCATINRQLHGDDIAGAVSVYGPPITTLLGDANNDNLVSGLDLIAIQQQFGRTGTANGLVPGDANDDGLVSGLDLIVVQQNFGKAMALAVPEPATQIVILCVMVGLGRRMCPPCPCAVRRCRMLARD